MIYLNASKWEGSFSLPALSDLRWRIFALLLSYLIMGMTLLGFSRKPFQVFLLIAIGGIFDVILSLLIKNRKMFPLSAMISCCSLAILLNWSFDFHNLFLPVFVCIASKYLITLNGKHFFNPSLFAICFCVLLGGEYVTLAPSYQWYGTAESAWVMMYFVATAGLLFFVFKINRVWLISSFIFFFVIQTIIRALVMKHVIPFETLFVGALTSPAFYLFTFYMITDPSTSPSKKSDQIIVGAGIALLDLVFHLKFSLYTFFFAGLTVASLRYIYLLGKKYYDLGKFVFPTTVNFSKYAVLSFFAIPVFWSFNQHRHGILKAEDLSLEFTEIPSNISGLKGAKGNTLEQTDTRIQHVAKWIISVGDAAAVGDVNLDGLPDLFMTQPLKTKDDMAKLYINQGGLSFEKQEIEDLERYLLNPKENGIPGFAYFMDYDNDGDKDLFVGFGFGKSHLFENTVIPTGVFSFKEKSVPFLDQEHTICLAANGMDYNNDGKLDMILTNTLHQYLPDYTEKTPLNIFDLPQPKDENDRRMFHFMHESWHNANNGGKNYMLLNTGDSSVYQVLDESASLLRETRWSLAVGTLDMNDDGYTDLFVANDFGRDDWYLNNKGNGFIRQEGDFYGDIGLDTYKGMNASVGDLDGNGQEDIYVSNVHHEMQAEGSLLWMNKTTKNASKIDFKESAQRHNLLNTNRFGWGAAIGDLDLNGWTDVVQANGMVDDSWDKLYDEAANFWYYQAQIARTGPEIHSYADKWADVRGCYIYPNELDRISLNMGQGNFIDATEALQFTHKANTRGIVTADFDNDGDLDILVTNQFGEPFLYRNDLKEKNWLGVILEGNGHSTNKDAVGTKVWLTYNLNGKFRSQYKEVRLANGFMAMGDNRLLFGLEEEMKDLKELKVTIRWHNGKEENIDIKTLNEYKFVKQDQ